MIRFQLHVLSIVVDNDDVERFRDVVKGLKIPASAYSPGAKATIIFVDFKYLEALLNGCKAAGLELQVNTEQK